VAGKLVVRPEDEKQVIERFKKHCVTICHVGSACAKAARYTVCGSRKLINAVRCGSLHAIDYAPQVGWDNETDKGGAIRLAFNVNTITAWAIDDAAIVRAHRLENAARLNAFRTAPTLTACGAGSIATITTTDGSGG